MAEKKGKAAEEVKYPVKKEADKSIEEKVDAVKEYQKEPAIESTSTTELLALKNAAIELRNYYANEEKIFSSYNDTSSINRRKECNDSIKKYNNCANIIMKELSKRLCDLTSGLKE